VIDERQAGSGGVVRIERWPTEWPLRIVIALASLAIWGLLTISVIGLIYAFFIGLFLFTTHLALLARVRGSAVRLGPEQFPELHRRTEEIAARAGLSRMPEAYVMQAGGVLNAFAAKFLRSDIVVLFSELLNACGDDEAARDMVIAHEIGHIRCGHLPWRWLLFPGLVVPFLGSANIRACEYTCDRYGAALCGDRAGALRGMAILAAGGRHGPSVRLDGFVAQRRSLDTGFMTLGTWLATHLPLSDRIAAIDPSLAERGDHRGRGTLLAIGILVSFAAVFFVGGSVAIVKFGTLINRRVQALQAAQMPSRAPAPPPKELSPSQIETDRAKVKADFAEISKVAAAFHARHGRYPNYDDGLSAAWKEFRPGVPFPDDPFDGDRYGYGSGGDRFWLWSAGPDRESDTDDDIEFNSAAP
jgi:Zn-dependent protease with chaperone function